jgi:hypothetical protein
MGLHDDLVSLEERISAIRKQLLSAHDVVRASITRLEAALARIADSWSGSFAGYHALLYFRDFQHPDWDESFSPEWGGIRGLPEGWSERTPDEVQRAIETIADARIVAIEEAAEPLAHGLAEVRDDIAVELSPIRQLPALATEAKMLDALETMPLRV